MSFINNSPHPESLRVLEELDIPKNDTLTRLQAGQLMIDALVSNPSRNLEFTDVGDIIHIIFGYANHGETELFDVTTHHFINPETWSQEDINAFIKLTSIGLYSDNKQVSGMSANYVINFQQEIGSNLGIEVPTLNDARSKTKSLLMRY